MSAGTAFAGMVIVKTDWTFPENVAENVALLQESWFLSSVTDCYKKRPSIEIEGL